MQCMILFPGRDGGLPSVEEMRRAGFVLSAALGRAQAGADHGEGAGAALAAEGPAAYPAPPGPEPLSGPPSGPPQESGPATGSAAP